jgi:predicted RND superfamily exporter protein
MVSAATLAAGLGTTRLRSADFLEGHLTADDPQLATFQRLADEFGSDQVAVFAIACGEERSCADVFEPDVLGVLRELSRTAQAQAGVEEVASLATAGTLSGADGLLRMERLEDAPDPISLARFRARATEDPLLRGTLVSHDLRTAALIVRLDADLADDARNGHVLRLYRELRQIAGQYGFELFASGHSMRVAVADEYVRRDLSILTPVMLALLAALLAWMFRNPAAVGITLATVALPMVWAFGLMCWAGRPLSPVVSTMPILILVVGVTDAVHLLVRVFELRHQHDRMDDVVRSVVRDVGSPTTVTAITSALGFLSFLAGRIPNLRDFGIFAAVGILACWLTTFTFVPACIVLLRDRTRPRTPPAFALGEAALDGARRLAIRRPWLVLGVAGISLAVSAVGIISIVPDNDTMKLFGEGAPIVQAERFLRERLRPLDTIEVLYGVPPRESVTDPEVLARLAHAELVLEERTGVSPVLSVLPVLRVAHRELVDGSLRLPDTPEGAAQLLLLAEAADPEAIHRVVTPDRRVARLSAGYAWAGSRSVREDLAALTARLPLEDSDARRWSLTGSLVLTAHMSDVILESQIASFSAAFLTIFGVLFLFVRSVPLGLLGVVPNSFPVALVLGFMGLAQINLDVGTAMIASILLGVSVDDTVYFLLNYQRARAGGAGVRDAVAYTFAVAGKPALFCAAILALGFFVLSFSSFQSLAIFGLLSGVAVLFAALTEILLLPALLEVVAARREDP